MKKNRPLDILIVISTLIFLVTLTFEILDKTGDSKFDFLPSSSLLLTICYLCYMRIERTKQRQKQAQ